MANGAITKLIVQNIPKITDVSELPTLVLDYTVYIENKPTASYPGVALQFTDNFETLSSLQLESDAVRLALVTS